MSRCYIPVLDEAGNVTSYVPKQTVTTDETGAEQKTDRLYWDDTKQPRYEFLDRSTVQIPGNKAISNNNSGSLGDHGVSGRFFDFDMQTGQRQSVVVDAETPAAASAEQTQELRYWRLISSNTHHDCDWYSLLMNARTYQLTKAQTNDPTKDPKQDYANYVDRGIEKWSNDIADEKNETDPDWAENILWAEDSLHLQMAWLAGYANLMTDRYYAGDINGENDQIEAKEYTSGYSRFLYADPNLRVYTPAMQYGDKFQTRLTAINYGDWPLDGVTFTYVYPLGTMPELDDDDNPVIRDAQYGGALGDTDTATVGSIQLQTSAIILQRPDKDGSPVKKLDKDGHTAELYKAPKIAKDPVLADDYDSGIEETDSYYSDEDVPWVVQVQVKNPLKQWWGRNLTEPSTEKQYQITVDLSGVVYGQPDQEKYYDMVYVAPWTEEDGTQNQNALYCQIYDESYRSGDMLPGMANNSYTSWLPKNNYQQIYGMDKFYKYKGYYTYSPYSSYISTSNPRVYAPFTPYFTGRNWFSSTYEKAQTTEKIPKKLDSHTAFTDYWDGASHYAVSGSQARLLKPVVRHWSEVADGTIPIQNQTKFDEFYQELETPFTISLFAENQSVMNNLKLGYRYSSIDGKLQESAKTLHYLPYDELSGTGSGKVLKYTYPFISYNNNYGYVPDYDDLNGGYIQTYDTEKGIYQNPANLADINKAKVQDGAAYPVPTLSVLLPEGIVPVDEDGKPWPKNPQSEQSWSNSDPDFMVRVRNVSTLQDKNGIPSADANQTISDPTVSRKNYRAEVEYIAEAKRYMVRLVPKEGVAVVNSDSYDPLTNPQDSKDMNKVLNAPKLAWNKNIQMDVRVMAVEMPDAEVTASNDHDQSIAYAKENEPESNILLRRWQQSRSFASAWIDGFKFLTDDRNDNEKGDSVFHEVGNPFSVGQEYSGYYMDHVNCGTGERFGYPESYSYRDYDHRNSYHIFRDTRLDSTGPDGRIKDRTLLGDMERGKESDTSSFVDVEDYSGNNIKEQSDLEKEGFLTARVINGGHGLRKPVPVLYQDLDVNGNKQPGMQEDGKTVGGAFVENTMKIYVKNPNIMLDKRVALDMESSGTGDNDGWPDYQGRSLPNQDGTGYESDYDDYAENPNLIIGEDSVEDAAGNGLDQNGIGYGSRLWYTITVLNKPSDSPMQKENDSSNPDAGGQSAQNSRLDNQKNYAKNEYLTDENGNRRVLDDLTDPTDTNGKPLEPEKVLLNSSNVALKVHRSNPDDEEDAAKLTQYEESLRLRRKKLSESGHVAHGAFVFSDYLPWTLTYDSDENLSGIRIQTYDEFGKGDRLLTAEQAKKEGWTIYDETPGDITDDKVEHGFVRITVIPPAVLTTQEAVENSDQPFAENEGDAYKSIVDGNRPSGYLASGQKFAVKIRTKVVNIPSVGDPEAADSLYDENGRSKEIFYNRAFVNLEKLDGHYDLPDQGILVKPENSSSQEGWFGNQNEDSISYYSGTDTYSQDGSSPVEKTTVRDGAELPASKFINPASNSSLNLQTNNKLSIETRAGEDKSYNQRNTEGHKDRYAFDTAAGFRVVSPMGYARVTTSRPVEMRSGSPTDPAYKSVDDINMYMAETSLLRGTVGALYTVSNLPLYGRGLNEDSPDISAANLSEYSSAYKVTTTVKSVKPGVWSIPDKGLPDIGIASKDYVDELEKNLTVSLYYTSRTKTGDYRQEITDGFDLGNSMWEPLLDINGDAISYSLAKLKGSDAQKNGVEILPKIQKDINQIMWVISGGNNEEVMEKYPIPAGFRLDVDTDYRKAGKQDAHTVENLADGSVNGYYPRHEVSFATSSNADDMQTDGGLICMNLDVANDNNMQLRTSTYTANYTTAYIKYGRGRYSKLYSNDYRHYGTSDKPGKSYAEVYSRSGMILTQYKPYAELKLDGRYFKENSKDGKVQNRYFAWSNELNVTSTSNLVGFTVTLDNIDQDRLRDYGDPDAEQKEDNFMNPTIVVKVPKVLLIDSKNFSYVPYDEVEKDSTNPLNPAFTRKQNSYGENEPLYWTYRVVHREYDADGNVIKEEQPQQYTDADLKNSGVGYQPCSTDSSDEFLLKFFFTGTLKPGDTIVIDYLARSRVSDASDPLTRDKETNAYATDQVGNPQWVKWKSDDPEETGIHRVSDGKDYDNDSNTSDMLLMVRNDVIGFEIEGKYPRMKLVSTVLDPDEELSSKSIPVPVLEGENYDYSLLLINSAKYSIAEPDTSLKLEPILYDVLPYPEDERIISSNGKSVSRSSMWNPWMLPEKENFTLTMKTTADEQIRRVTDKGIKANSDGSYNIPDEEYQIWVGPVVVDRSQDGDPNEIGLLDVSDADSIQAGGINNLFPLNLRGDINDFYNNLYQQLAVSAYGTDRPNNKINYDTKGNRIQDNHITLEELDAYRKAHPEHYEELRKSLRDIAVTFKKWDDTSEYKMYATTSFILKYRVETPLNLPVYIAAKDEIKQASISERVQQYKAANSFVGTTDGDKPQESGNAITYVFNPEDRGEIGDYVWLDDNANGKQDEIEYAVPEGTAETGFSRLLPKRKAARKDADTGNLVYDPDWGDGLPDPGINGVKVELLDENGLPCNYNGEAVGEKRADGKYPRLNPDGKPMYDASTGEVLSGYGPLSTVTKSDYYGNQGYYIFPNLLPGNYRLRFTMPEEYNDYGLTTWEIGKKADASVGMQVLTPDDHFDGFGAAGTGQFDAKTLTFLTSDVIHVEASDTDEERVSYDIGVGLPVVYGGTVWIDENVNGIYDSAEGDDQEHGFVDYEYGETNPRAAQVVAVLKGQEKDASGALLPALDMRGKPMMTYTQLPKPSDPDTPDTQARVSEDLKTGEYVFPYMYPDKEYVFYVLLPTGTGGKTLYRLTQSLYSDPLKYDYDNDGKQDGSTNAFKTVAPKDASGNPLYITDETTGFVLRRQPQMQIGFGVMRADTSVMTGVIWDDSSDVQKLPDGSSAPYDGIHRDGYQGVKDVTVNLYAYGWAGEELGWRALEKDEESGELKFVEQIASIDATATPSDAVPVGSVQTTENGSWQFKLPTLQDMGKAYLVGYRVGVPKLPAGYTPTSLHSAAGDYQTDSDLAGNTWMYRRGKSKMDGTPGGSSTAVIDPDHAEFHYKDALEPSIYLPYDECGTDESGSVAGMNPVSLAGTWYDANMVHSIEAVDAGLIPYAKGTVHGVVWNDVGKELGRLTYNGLRDDGEERIAEIPVLLQYRKNDGFLNVYQFDLAHYHLDLAALGLTENDLWSSGSYLFPMSLRAEEILQAEAKKDVERRDEKLREAEQLQEKQVSVLEQLASKESERSQKQSQKAENTSLMAELQEAADAAELKQSAASAEAEKQHQNKLNADAEIKTVKDAITAAEESGDQEELDRLNEQLEALQNDSAHYQELYDQANAEEYKYRRQKEAYTSQVTAKEKENNVLTREINVLDRSITDLENQSADLTDKIAAAKAAAGDSYISIAMVKTNVNGEYVFDNLPMFDEREPLMLASGKVEDEPVPFEYRILVDKSSQSANGDEVEFTTFHVSNDDPKKKDINSDVQVLSEDDYTGENLSARLGIDRSDLGVSDSFRFMQRDENLVNSYDGHFHVRMDQDEPEEIREMRTAQMDAGLLLIRNQIVIGGYVWNDADRDGKQDASEQAVPGATVILYRYNPDADEAYYTYEVVDDAPLASPSKASPSIATSSDQKSDLKNTGNAWIDKDREAGSDVTLAGKKKIRITGIQTRGAWQIYKDGTNMVTTGSDGRYEFTVPAVNKKATNPEDRLYRYRVKIIQPNGQETMIWSDLQTNNKREDSDIVPSNAFMDLRVDRLDKMFGNQLKNNLTGDSNLISGRIPKGTELEIPGIYDPGNRNKDLLSGLGDVNGMVDENSCYRIGISSEFNIYEEPAVQNFARAVRSLAKANVSSDWMPNLCYIKDDLTMDAGMFAQEKPVIPDEPQPNRPGGHGGHGGGGHAAAQPTMPTIEPFPEETTGPAEEENPGLFAIPKTGVFPIGLGAFFVALISGAVMFATRRRKEDEEEEHKDKKNEDK